MSMTLPSRQRIRNSSSGGLRPSTLPLGHGGSPILRDGLMNNRLHFGFDPDYGLGPVFKLRSIISEKVYRL